MPHFRFPVALAALTVLVAGCAAPPEGPTEPDTRLQAMTLTFSGLEPLGTGWVYEGWLVGPSGPVSSGRFSVLSDGKASPERFLVPASLAAAATAVIVTIEPAAADDPAPSAVHVLAGNLVGGGAMLTIDHPSAIGTDFSSAAGSYVLNTPSTAALDLDYALGIWWLTPVAGGAVASLTLPVLPAGWTYEGWVVGPLGPVSTGRFLSASGADSDGAGGDAGVDAFPPFPGQDFILPPMPLAGFAAVISVEPMPDDSPAPFALKPLVDGEIVDVGQGVSQPMQQNLLFPRGEARIA